MTTRHRDAVGFVVAGLVVAVLGWRELALLARPGLDTSWNAALSMAAHSDLGWGRELVFTYGPLGFLRHPTFWYEGTGALAVLYTFATRVALAGGLWYFGRRTFGGAGAALVALVVVPFVANPLPPLVFGWALWLLVRERTARHWAVFAVGAGLLGGLELLGKVNTGVLIVALGAITVASAPRDRVRLVATYAAATVTGLLVGWVAAGQRLLDLNDYLVNAVRVASGYSTSMLTVADNLAWHYSAALIVFALAAYGAWTATASSPPRARVGALAVTLALSFMAFKSAFVRHDQSHALEFFAVLLPALVVIPWRRSQRAFGVAAVAAALLVVLALTGERLDRVVDPFERADDAWKDISTLVQPGERRQLVDDGREALRAAYGLDPAIVTALAGHPVHVEPYETAVAWAHDFRWKPLPVFHGYQAYTAALDRLNAASLRAPAAPSRVLLGNHEPVDLRVAAWESPATIRAMLCRYQPLLQRGTWIVLGRAEDRCGQERLIETRRARWGEQVPVPPRSAEGMVIVKIDGVAPGLGERLRAAAYKGHVREVRFDGGDAHRLVPGTVGNGLLLHAPEPLELPPGFPRAPGPQRMSIHRAGDAGGTLRYDFYLVPFVA